MGLAASQARFLGLTARMSNTEYEGQQINQQRSALADQSAGLFNQMLTLQVPTPPDVNSFNDIITYTFTDPDGIARTATAYKALVAPDPNAGKYQLTYSDGTTGIVDSITIANNLLTSVKFTGVSTINVGQQRNMDDTGYNVAMTQYTYQKDLYDQGVANINAKTATLQQQDKTLELKLKQLDSEQQAFQTEIEAVKKVIDKNIDLTFKTFA